MEQLVGAALERYGGLRHRRTAALYPFARCGLACGKACLWEKRLSWQAQVEGETTAGAGRVRNQAFLSILRL